MRPDRESLSKPFPWDKTQQACQVDFYTKEGEPWVCCGRYQMKKALAAAKELGLEVKIGFELEFAPL